MIVILGYYYSNIFYEKIQVIFVILSKESEI